MYGSTPVKRLRLTRNRPKITAICNAFARLAKMPPPTVALHTHHVVMKLKATNAA